MKAGNDHFLLDGHKVISARGMDLILWASLCYGSDRHVAETILPNKTRISTVFLGLDHNWDRAISGKGKPLVFETMVFPSGGIGDENTMRRYSTWKEAEKGHHEMVVTLETGEN